MAEVDSDSNAQEVYKTENKDKIMDDKENVEDFVKAKKKLNNKLKAFESIYKFYKHIIVDEILVSLNKSLKFLEKYELIIITTINKYNSDENGYLNSHQLRMLLTVAQRFLFDKIFVNYLLPNISKYYNFIMKKDIENMKKDIEKLIDMLRFVNTDGKNFDTTDSKHMEMRNNILSNLSNNKFRINYDNKKREFNDSLNKNDGEDNLSFELKLTEVEKKGIKDSVSCSFINKFETLENKFMDIQSTALWWSILKDSLIKELTNSNKEYVNSVIIFIKQMLTESINNDILGLQHLSVRRTSKNRTYSGDSNLYAVYNDHLKNNINKIFESLENLNRSIDGDENSINDNMINKIDKISDDFTRALDNEYNQIIGTSSLTDAISIYQLKNVKTKLTNNFNSYTSILKSIITATQKEKTSRNGIDKSNYSQAQLTEKNKVSKHDFRKIIETLIIYIKQNLFNFFDIYQNYISDLRLQYQSKLFEITEKLNEN
jgi:hypothetical protein